MNKCRKVVLVSTLVMKVNLDQVSFTFKTQYFLFGCILLQNKSKAQIGIRPLTKKCDLLDSRWSVRSGRLFEDVQ